MLVIGLAGCAATNTRESTSEYVDDSVVTTRVKTALLKEPGVKSNQIEVETYRGVVQLSGFVDSPDMAQRAGARAKDVNGVKVVKNDIRVKPGS